MYIRKLRKPSPNKNVYKFASIKQKAAILCESSLEKDCCYHFEYDSDVVSFESQPRGYYYKFDGKTLPYTPDFLTLYIDGSQEYIECKPYSQTLSKEFKAKFSARQQAARELGNNLILVTEKQIRAGVFLNNCMLVHRYSGCIDGGELVDIVHSQIVADKCVRVNELALKIGHTIGEVFATVLRLVSIGLASMDLESRSLTENSLVKVV